MIGILRIKIGYVPSITSRATIPWSEQCNWCLRKCVCSCVPTANLQVKLYIQGIFTASRRVFVPSSWSYPDSESPCFIFIEHFRPLTGTLSKFLGTCNQNIPGSVPWIITISLLLAPSIHFAVQTQSSTMHPLNWLMLAPFYCFQLRGALWLTLWCVVRVAVPLSSNNIQKFHCFTIRQ